MDISAKKIQFYDTAFKEVISAGPILRSLARDIINRPWAGIIDLNKPCFEDPVSKGINLAKRSNDLLVSFTYLDAPRSRLYVLFEFQSTWGPMLFRIHEYVNRIQRQQVKVYNTRYSIIPVVIYNNRLPLPNARVIERRDQTLFKETADYLFTCPYILIDEHRLDDHWLYSLRAPAAYFFLLDKTLLDNVSQAKARIIGILELIKIHAPDAYDVLFRYVQALLEHRGMEIPDISRYDTRRRETMLGHSLDELAERERMTGQLLSKQNVLTRQLSKKFGLTKEEPSMIGHTNDPGLLDEALDAFVDADTKEKVLAVLREGKTVT